MSIVQALASSTGVKLIIPKAGKMFFSSVSKKNKALGIVLNKGYFQSLDLNMMNDLFDLIPESKDNIFVGATDKVLIKGKIYYRQRIFFKNLNYILDICKEYGIEVDLPYDFKININNVLNVVSYLKYLEIYASHFNEDIDTYLTNITLLRLNSILEFKHMKSRISNRADTILKNKRGYFDRAPFLISRYSLEDKTSAIFLEADLSDERLFSIPIEDKKDLIYGFTLENIKKDKKANIFHS